MRTRRTKTSSDVARSRVELIPSNTLLASAEYPPGPVTFTVRPLAATSFAVSEIDSTALISTSSSPRATIGTTRRAALPSSENRGSPTGRTPSGGAALIAVRTSSTAARSSAVRPSSRANTGIAYVPSALRNSLEASSTATDSASLGKKLVGSFFSFDSSDPICGPSATSTASQAPRTTNFVQRPAMNRTTASTVNVAYTKSIQRLEW